jgi:mycothiol synthase
LPVRKFTWQDLPALLDFIGTVQAQNRRDRKVRQRSFQENLQQPDLYPEENCLLLEYEARIQGCCLILPESPIGRAVLALDLAPHLEGGYQEEDLVQQAIGRAGELHAKIAHICLGPDSRRSELLQRRGFHRERVYWDMVWQGGRLPEVAAPSGFILRNFRTGDAAALAEVQNAAFAGSWGFCPNTVEQIDYRSHLSNTSHQGILFLYDQDHLAGYCWTCIAPSDGKTRGIIGMIGIAPDYRGQGLSQPVLVAGMRYLQSISVDEIGLHVDRQNTPAIRLYNSVGFEKVGELHWYEYCLR